MMVLCNRSIYRGYVLGHIIPFNSIYKIANFEESFVEFIRESITNEKVIKILNDMFYPITGPGGYAEVCDQYRFVALEETGEVEKDVIYNNDIIEYKEFYKLFKNQSFNKDDIILLHSDVAYWQKLTKVETDGEDADPDSI